MCGDGHFPGCEKLLESRGVTYAIKGRTANEPALSTLHTSIVKTSAGKRGLYANAQYKLARNLRLRSQWVQGRIRLGVCDHSAHRSHPYRANSLCMQRAGGPC